MSKILNNIIILFLLFLPVLLFAQEEKESESFDFTSDSSRIILPQGKKQIIFSGNAVVESDTIRITADEIRRFGSDLQFTRCIGNVIAIDSDRDIKIVSDELLYDTDQDIITIETYSELTDNKNNIFTKSGYLQDNRNDKKTLLSIDVKIYKDDIVCVSQFAWFDHDQELLELTGRPIVYRDGNALRADKISYYINSGELYFDGGVEGQVDNGEKE